MMLRPTKHTHPDHTVVNVTLNLLSHIRLKRIASFDEMRSIVRKISPNDEALYLPALSLLYLLGTIEYHKKIDSFEYVGKS